MQCPVPTDCAAAAFHSNIANTEELVMWTSSTSTQGWHDGTRRTLRSSTIALHPGRWLTHPHLRNEIFYTCSPRPLSVTVDWFTQYGRQIFTRTCSWRIKASDAEWDGYEEHL